MKCVWSQADPRFVTTANSTPSSAPATKTTQGEPISTGAPYLSRNDKGAPEQFHRLQACVFGNASAGWVPRLSALGCDISSPPESLHAGGLGALSMDKLLNPEGRSEGGHSGVPGEEVRALVVLAPPPPWEQFRPRLVYADLSLPRTQKRRCSSRRRERIAGQHARPLRQARQVTASSSRHQRLLDSAHNYGI